MKNIIAIALIASIVASPAVGQEQQQQNKTVIQQTPFGPRQVEAPASQQQPASPAAPVQTPTAAPAAPASTPPPAAAAQPAPAQGQPQQPADEVTPISLQLDNTDIYQVIRIIGDALKLNYIIDPSVKGTVNISTAGTLRRSDLLPILETILKINGATMVKTGNFYEVVGANTATRQPLEVQEKRTTAPDDQMIMQILRMKFVSAGEMSKLLTPYLTEGANMVVHEAGNVLLITERRSNLRKLLEIIDIFDTNVFEGARVRIFPVKNSLAKDLVNDLRSIFNGYALSDNNNAIRFVVIDRLNSLLVVTPNSAAFAEVEKWLDRLDQPVQLVGRRNYIYRLNNAKAKDIYAVLSQLYGLQPQGSGRTQPGPIPLPNQPAGSQPQVENPFAAGSQAGAGAQGTAIASANVRIIADDVNNALVIQATPQEYSEIEKTIRDLDVLPRQVLVDAQIYEVVLDHSLSFGLSAILQNRGTLANPQTTGSFAGTPPALSVQTFSFVGRTRELIAFLNASENRSRVRTLSAPSVLVTDNTSAQFTVGADVPVPTTSSLTPVQSGGTNLFAQTIAFRSTGVILSVKPQINSSGVVTLDISQEVSQAGANTTSAVVAPVIGKSAVTSTIVVRDNQTISMGGFIRENNDLSNARIPLLGNIPGMGVLLGNTRRTASRTELIVLITPHVIRDHQEADAATEELKTKLQEVKKLLK